MRERGRLEQQAARETARYDQQRLQSAKALEREYVKLEREKVKAAAQAARDAAKSEKGSGGGFLSSALSFSVGNMITGALSGAVGEIQQAVSTGMDFNRLRETTMLGLTKKLGGPEAAEKFFNSVAKFAQEESPLKIPQAAAQANRLIGLGFKPDEIIPLLRAAGDAAAGMGKVGDEALEKVEQITKALSDIRGKQRVNAEELSRQLQEAGVKGWEYIAEELQRQDPKLASLSKERVVAIARDLAEKNRLDANAAVNAIVRGIQK